MKPDAFRVLSVLLILVFAFITFDVILKNVSADRVDRQNVQAQEREVSNNLRKEHERKLFLKQEMAQGKPQRSKPDCAKSLQAIQNKRRELLRENRQKNPKAEPISQVIFLVCKKSLTWLDGSYIPVPLEYEPGRPCKPGEERLYSMFGCPLEMIQQLPGPF